MCRPTFIPITHPVYIHGSWKGYKIVFGGSWEEYKIVFGPYYAE